MTQVDVEDAADAAAVTGAATGVADRDAALDGPAPHHPLRRVGTPSLWSSRELILNLTRREVSGKYKRTTLGHLWSLVNPLSTMLVYTLVFAVILKTKPLVGNPSGLHVYALFLMVALLPYTFFNAAVTAGMRALVDNANLVTKVYFRRDVLVISSVLSQLVTFGFETVVLIVALLGFGGMPLPWLPLAVVVIAVLTVFALGLALLLAVANVYFRDTSYLVGIVFQLWFYLTPILYPATLVGAKLSSHRIVGGFTLYDLYDLNPLTRFTDVLRNLLYDNRFPQWGDVAYCVGSAVVVLAVGAVVFRRFESRLAEEL